jgi:Ni/Co efflux regulator RcnB
MKMKSTLLAVTLAAFAASTVYAADDAMTKKDESPKAEKAEAKKPAKKHDHGAEKGTPAAESKAGTSHREMMDKDMPMHDHTQDRK